MDEMSGMLQRESSGDGSKGTIERTALVPKKGGNNACIERDIAGNKKAAMARRGVMSKERKGAKWCEITVTSLFTPAFANPSASTSIEIFGIVLILVQGAGLEQESVVIVSIVAVIFIAIKNESSASMI